MVLSAVYMVLIAGLAGFAWVCTKREARAISTTAVSTFASTDYQIPQPVLWMIWGAGGLTLIVLLAFAVLGVSLVGGVLVALAFALLRHTIATLIHTAADLSQDIRQSAALSQPRIQGAKFAFYFSAPDLSAPEHVRVWQDEMMALGMPWFVILREPGQLAHFAGADQPTAIFIKKNASLANCLPAGLKAVFYANNGQQNRPMIAGNPQVKHVQLLHGDSDKPPSYSPLTKNYDLVFVAGQMGIDRYARHGVDIPPSSFRIVGRPQVQAIQPPRIRGVNEPAAIVYMPTWRGFFEDTQFSSLGKAAQIIDHVLSSKNKCHLTFKPHPLSYKDPAWPRLEAEIKAALSKTRAGGNGGTFCENGEGVFDLYNQADLLIADISSVMIDFLYSGKPFLVIKPDGFTTADKDKYPSLAASYRVNGDLGNLSALLQSALDSDPMKASRSDMQSYAFGDYGRTPGRAFRDACLALLENALPSGKTGPKLVNIK